MVWHFRIGSQQAGESLWTWAQLLARYTNTPDASSDARMRSSAPAVRAREAVSGLLECRERRFQSGDAFRQCGVLVARLRGHLLDGLELLALHKVHAGDDTLTLSLHDGLDL